MLFKNEFHPLNVWNNIYSVKHLVVRTKSELQHALWKSQKDQDDCVIEVESSIADNAKFHRFYPLACALGLYFQTIA